MTLEGNNLLDESNEKHSRGPREEEGTATGWWSWCLEVGREIYYLYFLLFLRIKKG